MNQPLDYPVRFSVEYPDRELNRLTSFFRPFVALPIVVVLSTILGQTSRWADDNGVVVSLGTGGLLVLGPMLMIVVRRKYPRWWFEWNIELLRFTNRVGAYLALMDDRYLSTDQQQSVRLHFSFPDAERDLNQWMPLVKWLLAVPHYFVLVFLALGAIFAVIIAWFAILLTGRYPRGLFHFVEGAMRWHNRVIGYAAIMITDQYPPFSLGSASDRPPDRPLAQ